MSAKTILAFIVLSLVAALTSACRPSEQGKKLEFKKGVYLGAKDQTLTEEQQKLLRQRALRQGI